ncbi:hypothetical protein ADIS_4845 [Lunatimonas lonarensis]|uniref:Uncharacterized protein n=1 Tax=Lunatimonas lonarensis TaxID=1232681 RepID=R7ZL27_9BACT|nr:hypothetical protein ADIS_4845 [Lunatimonas lonarensis]
MYLRRYTATLVRINGEIALLFRDIETANNSGEPVKQAGFQIFRQVGIGAWMLGI